MKRKRGARRLLRWLGLLATLGALVLVWRAERKLSQLVLGGLGESFSTKVYSAPRALEREAPPAVLERLRRLGYREVEAPAAPGEYVWDAPVLRVYLRGYAVPPPAQAAGLFTLTSAGDGAWSAVGPDGPVDPVRLEPELVAELSGPKRVRREPIAAEDIPETLKRAVVAVEDKRFFRHPGIDFLAVARSAWRDATGSELQGGSTITQQLVKNLFLSPRRTLRRKLKEAALALYLEARMSKSRILTLYLNHIYLGQDGALGVAGVRAAATFYFGKDLRALSLPESALLAGLIRSPYRYNPRRDPAAARARRDFVLRRMRAEDLLTDAELSAALAQPLAVVPAPPSRGPSGVNDYSTAQAVRELLPRYGEVVLLSHGLSIHTTIDVMAQAAAQAALRKIPHQGALIALDPASGRILAMAGGRDFIESPFNRATRSRRQPGSAFKPFLYGAALEQGFTPASPLEDQPRRYPGGPGGRPWRPANHDGRYRGTTTLRTALAFSLNAASIDLAAKVGPASVVEFARRMGIESPLEPSLALALGTSEVTLAELAGAYAPFANGGFRARPGLVAAVYDAEGEVLEFSRFEREPVLDPARAYLLTDLLRSVTREGTAKGLLERGWEGAVAGKTGTTDDGRDAWFVGYTPDLLAGVWVGDDRTNANVTGAGHALPVWEAFMKTAAPPPPKEFPRPGGLVSIELDPDSGALANAGCPTRTKELFLEGTQPKSSCPLHKAGVLGWLKQLFRR